MSLDVVAAAAQLRNKPARRSGRRPSHVVQALERAEMVKSKLSGLVHGNDDGSLQKYLLDVNADSATPYISPSDAPTTFEVQTSDTFRKNQLFGLPSLRTLIESEQNALREAENNATPRTKYSLEQVDVDAFPYSKCAM